MPHPETLANAGFVCPDHAPKAGQFKDKPKEWFVGKVVKLGFPVPDAPKDGPTHEHMWVQCTALYSEPEREEELQGPLQNHPIFIATLKHSDVIAFTRDEVEQVYGLPDTRGEPHAR